MSTEVKVDLSSLEEDLADMKKLEKEAEALEEEEYNDVMGEFWQQWSGDEPSNQVQDNIEDLRLSIESLRISVQALHEKMDKLINQRIPTSPPPKGMVGIL
jgi:chaperonin cofactor prefoldin